MPTAKAKSVKKTARRNTVLPSEIKLSARDRKRLLRDIATPPAPNKKLKRAAVRYKQLSAQSSNSV